MAGIALRPCVRPNALPVRPLIVDGVVRRALMLAPFFDG